MSSNRQLVLRKPWDFAAEERKRVGWIAIAERVIKGDYNNFDSSTKLSLSIGLRGYADDICKRAYKILNP